MDPITRAPRSRLRRLSSALRYGALSIAVALGGTPLAAEITEVSVGPQAPTWRDPVEITVAGAVVTSCGPYIVHLGEPRLSFESGLGWVIDVDLTYDDCPILAPPSRRRFTVRTEGDPVVPGVYTIRVHDEVSSEFATAPLTVHEVSPLELVLPTAARSDEPAALRLRGWASCPYVEVQRGGDVLYLFYTGECAILPPSPVVFELEEPVGPLPSGDYRVIVYDYDRFVGGEIPSIVKGAFRVWDVEGCVPSDTVLCLQGGRFRVEVSWTSFDDRSGAGRAIPRGEDSGFFWFFGPDNIELTVRVLDGCGVNGHFWVFVAGGSTVEYQISVTDTRTNETRTYGKEPRVLPQLVADTKAFSSCP